MRDEGLAAVVFAFDLSDEPPTVERASESPPHLWPLGTQPMSVAWDDDAVQVMLDDGCWHRQASGMPETACDIKIDYRKSLGIRPSSYLGTLCQRGCFSHHELDVLAPRARAQHDAEQAAQVDQIVDGAHQTRVDGDIRRRKKTDK